MTILGIETSCDETALCIIEADGPFAGADKKVTICVLADKTLSQAALHARYGGVFPNLAKREHSRNLILLLEVVLTESGFGNPKSQTPNPKQILNSKLEKILNREPELLTQFLEFIPTIKKPPIDAIAVTVGPGLEPCLWTGVNFAEALSLVWDIPIVPVNHMEGHIFSALLRRKNEFSIFPPAPKRLRRAGNSQFSRKGAISYKLKTISFPALALLISGGHTELVLVKDWFDYEIIGQTQDDAVGEAFDKVARLLGLPYPGGPEISRLAEEVRSESPLPKGVPDNPPAADGSAPFVKGDSARAGVVSSSIALPRPMLHSKDFDFSFSGLKTAVLYLLKKIGTPDEETKAVIAREFEDAVTEVLVTKTKKAIEHFGVKMLLIGGGVIANAHIRRAFERLVAEMNVPLFIPEESLTTDNALMIAVAGLMRYRADEAPTTPLKARGNLRLDEKI